MNRPEYRFWDKDLKKMCFRKPAHNDFSHPNIIPLEKTPFPDTEGKPIFEGDQLVDIDVEIEEGWNSLEESKQQVYWCEKKGAWMLDHSFKQDKSSGDLLSEELRDFRFKIAGNIYQPENEKQ